MFKTHAQAVLKSETSLYPESTQNPDNARLTIAPVAETAAQLKRLFSEQGEVRHYPIGAVLLEPHEPVPGVWWIVQGSVRSLAALPPQGDWRTVDRLGPGCLVGWLGLLHQQPLEHLRVAEPLQARFLPADRFEQLWHSHPALPAWCAAQTPPIEALQLLRRLAHGDPGRSLQLEQWQQLLPELHWWAADAADGALEPPPPSPEFSGQWWAPLDTAQQAWQRRLIWLPAVAEPETTALVKAELAPLLAPSSAQAPLELMPASGPLNIPLALCQALARCFNVPFNRDGLRDQVGAILQRQGQLNLINIGQLLSGMSLGVVMAEVPAAQLARVPTPAVLQHNGAFALLDGVDPDGSLRLLEPELGPLRLPAGELLADGQTTIELLLLQRRADSQEARFSWSWFGPYLAPHKRELIEVLVASAVVNTLALATPLGMQRLIDGSFTGSASLNGLLSISLLLLVAALVKAVVGGLRSLLLTGVANQVDMGTKATILDQMVRLPQGFFDSRPVGQITFYFQQLDRLREFLIGQSLTTIVDFGFSLLYIAVLLALNPVLTLVTLSTLPLFLVLALVSNPLVEHQIGKVVAAGVRTYSYLTEAITGIQTIKSQNAELKTRWDFQNRYAELIGEDYKLRVTAETIGKLAEFINELNGLLVIGVGLYMVYQNQLSLGAFIAFRIISGYVTGPLVKLVKTWQDFKRASENLKMVGDIVDRQTEQSEQQSTNIPMPPLQGDVQFQAVSFRYTPEGDRILHNVNLEIPCGAFVGMVGGSGSGKSTLLKLLPRFYEPEKGRVLIDGLDINKVELYSLRRQIGVVPQDSLLFDGTIKDNLLLVKPDATADELIRACKIACAHDFVMNLPQGYNSSVGERGAGLSGGQRQRMALARAVLQNPRMLILDEATSALDARTERQVCLNLFEAFRGRTVFFITHRLSTVRPADLIVLMDQGAVMEVGNHQRLIEQRGWYYALYQSQAQEN